MRSDPEILRQLSGRDRRDYIVAVRQGLIRPVDTSPAPVEPEATLPIIVVTATEL